MNLTKLFESQKVLRDRIGYNEPDRFNKLILALLVELGECANEWRGFKFWSKDQEPRTGIQGLINLIQSGVTKITKENAPKNPLLEEYVDGLHFVLELGLEIEFDCEGFDFNCLEKYDDITSQFTWIYNSTTEFFIYSNTEKYDLLLSEYFGLGEMLGFTGEQIEEAYYKKNQINHERQNNGY